MIYLIHGDSQKVLKKSHDLVDSLLKKQPNASVLKFNSENFQTDEISALVEGQGLFFQKQIVTFHKILDKKNSEEKIVDEVLKNLKEMSESENIFIFTEEAILKSVLKKFEKVKAKTQEFEIKSGGNSTNNEGVKSRNYFNVFSLGDALINRDKRGIWVLYQEAEGIAPEEIFGVLWWQIKTLLLAEKCATASESGIKDFPFNKAKRALKNFKEGEVEKMATGLIEAYHDARLQSVDLRMKLEEFVLKV